MDPISVVSSGCGNGNGTFTVNLEPILCDDDSSYLNLLSGDWTLQIYNRNVNTGQGWDDATGGSGTVNEVTRTSSICGFNAELFSSDSFDSDGFAQLPDEPATVIINFTANGTPAPARVRRNYVVGLFDQWDAVDNAAQITVAAHINGVAAGSLTVMVPEVTSINSHQAVAVLISYIVDTGQTLPTSATVQKIPGTYQLEPFGTEFALG